MYNSPLEQFEIYPIYIISSLSIPKSVVGFLPCLIFFALIHYYCFLKKKLCLCPSRWTQVLESAVFPGFSIAKSIKEEAKIYFPFVIVFFLFVLVINVYGLAPYTFTLTSQLIFTIVIAWIIFGAICRLYVLKQGKKSFLNFLPPQTSLVLGIFLIFIEALSFFFKPLSMSVRLFANVITGHTLLMVIAGLAWTLLTKSGYFFGLYFFPLIVLLFLIGLEFGVALIQAYVFGVLLCVYLREPSM